MRSDSKLPNFKILMVVSVEICGMRSCTLTSMALVIEVKRTETVTELSIHDTNGGMQKKRGGKYGCGTEGENELR